MSGMMIQPTAESGDRLLNNSPVGLVSLLCVAVHVYSKGSRQ